MIRISGVAIPENKRLEISLQYVYGIGAKLARTICDNLKIDLNVRTKDLTSDQVAMIPQIIRDLNIKTEADLRREKANNIARKISIKSYAGIRHMRKLPVRGQRTHTNSKTARKGGYYGN